MGWADEERVRLAAVFADPHVAASYHGRPPYPEALYATLLAQTEGRARALDLGCGPGKIARVLADHFDVVVAVDVSAAMLTVGRADDGGRHPNIVWVEGPAEANVDGAFDLVTAGASIHWFDLAALFPKLAKATPLVATVNDAPVFPHPAPPCGIDAWIAFLNRWLPHMGRPPITAPPCETNWPPGPAPHEAWIDVAGHARFRSRHRQTVESFIACSHSRVSWNRPAMGQALLDAFDADLDALMRPFATEGMLEVAVVTDLTWGAPRATPCAT